MPAESGPPATVTCPPPSIAPSRHPARYSFIARRQTRSMLVTPLPAEGTPASGRRATLRLCLANDTTQQGEPSVRELAGGS